MRTLSQTFFYESAKFLSRNHLFLFIVIIFDYIQVFFPSFEVIENFLKYIQPNTQNSPTFTMVLYTKYFSVLSLTKFLSSCRQANGSTAVRQCTLPPYLLYTFTGLIVFFYLFLLFSRKKWIKIKAERPKDNSTKAVLKFIKRYFNLAVIYFYNILFYRLLSSLIIDVVINFIVNVPEHQLKLLFFVLPVLLIIIYALSVVIYFHYIHIYVKLDNHLLNFPFDDFSRRFDLFVLLLKVLISFSHNLSLQVSHNHSGDLRDLPMFFGAAVFALMIITTLNWLYELFFSKNSLLYYTNESMNVLRLFLLILNSLAMLIIVISMNIMSYTIVVSLLLASVLLSVLFVRYCRIFRENKAITKGNTILLMLFLIDYIWYGYSYPDGFKADYEAEYSQIMKKVIICHLSLCRRSWGNCSFCKTIKSNPEVIKYSFDNHAIFFSMLYDSISLDKKLIEENREKYDILTFFHKSKLYMNNPFNHSMSIIKTLKNFKKQSICYYLNMQIYYKSYIKAQKAIITRIETIYFIEKKTNELYQFIAEFEKILFFEEKKPTTIINGATTLYTLIKLIKKQLFNRLNSKNEYHSIIMQYIIESLTNTKLNFKDRVLFDISLYEEFLSDHFEADKNIVLNYEYNTNLAFITLVGTELIQYLKRPFNEIFHSSIREHAIEYFNSCITNSISNNTITKSLFSFPMSEKDNQSNVMAFKLKYSLMPSIHLESNLITGIYQINSDDIIVSLLDNKTKEEILLAYNKPLTRHIIIPSDFLSHLNQYRFPIHIKSMFTSVNHNKDDVYSIDYKYYLPVVQARLNVLFTDIKDSTVQLKLPKVKDLGQYQKKVRKMKIKDKAKYECSKSAYSCIVYSIVNEEQTLVLTKKDDFFTKLNVLEDNLFASFHNTKTTSTGNFLNSNSSVDYHQSNATSNRYLSGLSLEMRQKLQEDVTRKKKELKKFRTLTYIIILFNSILVIITIAFLITDIDSIIRFQNMFSFFQLWNKFICLFLNTSISIFVNVCVAPINSTECVNNLDLFSESFNEDNNLPPDFFIGIYVKFELTVKADLLQSFSKEVIRYIYSSMGPKAIEVFDADYHYRYVTYEEDKLIVKSEVYSFLNGLDVYINLINTIISNLDYANMPIYIVNIMGKTTSDIYLDNIDHESFTAVQMTEYNILFNYPSFIGSFMALNDIMSNQLRTNIKDCYNIINIFVILLVVIHLILFSICLLFINFFQNVIEDYYNESLLKMSLLPLMIGVKEKLLILKDILFYFKENPNKKIEQYTALVKKNTPNKNETKKSSNQAKPGEMQPKKPKQNTKRTFTIFNGVINTTTLIILFASFSSYIVYSLIFYLLLYYSITDYNHLIRTVDYGSNLDIYLYSAIGLIQMMILTNQTDFEIADYLNTETSKGYIRNLMDTSYWYLDQIEADESYHQTLIPRLRDSIDLGCSTLFDTLNDELLRLTDTKYNQRNYKAIMPKICDAYKIMSMKNDKLMISSIMFNLNKILLGIIHDIEPLLELKNSKEVFDMNVMLLLLYRPIRAYESGTLNSQIINEMTANYNTITYIYLLFNILIEVILFVLLRIFLIKKCIQIQKSMNMFVKCLKI